MEYVERKEENNQDNSRHLKIEYIVLILAMWVID